MRLPSILNRSRKQTFIRLGLNGLAQAVVTIATILLVRQAFDRLITPADALESDIMIQIGLGLGLAAVSIGWLRMSERVDAEKMGQSYIHQIRLLLFKRMSRLAPRALQNRSRGAVVLRFIGDLNALKRWVSLGLVRITVAGITTGCALTALALISWELALVVAGVLGLGALYAFRIGKDLRETVRESRKRRAYLAANVNEKVATMAVVQVFGQAVRERRRIKRQSRRLTDAMVARAGKIGLMRGITQSVTALASGAVLLLGAYVVGTGQATAGTVVAAMTIVGLLVPALQDLSRVYEYYQESRVSSQKIISFLKTPSLVTDRPGAPDLDPGPGCLEFKGVGLGDIVREMSVTARPGQVIAVTGPNGAGKSTLLHMAARLIDAESGQIFLDGQDIAQHSLKSVRKAVSMVSPDLPLLRGTVKKNLLYRCPKAPAEEIEKIWQLCGIHELLDELPQAELTRVTEDGNSLSLGQRQRIGIARAFLGNPRVILLDEADAHLDNEAGRVLNRVLSRFKGTILWVTHQPDHLGSADSIWHIEKGRLLDVTPPDLLCRSTG